MKRLTKVGCLMVSLLLLGIIGTITTHVRFRAWAEKPGILHLTVSQANKIAEQVLRGSGLAFPVRLKGREDSIVTAEETPIMLKRKKGKWQIVWRSDPFPAYMQLINSTVVLDIDNDGNDEIFMSGGKAHAVPDENGVWLYVPKMNELFKLYYKRKTSLYLEKGRMTFSPNALKPKYKTYYNALKKWREYCFSEEYGGIVVNLIELLETAQLSDWKDEKIPADLRKQYGGSIIWLVGFPTVLPEERPLETKIKWKIAYQIPRDGQVVYGQKNVIFRFDIQKPYETFHGLKIEDVF